MANIWLMRCYYCGVTITPPDGYRGEVSGVTQGQGVEVSFRAGGVGTGRVEYVLVLCPLCHHMLRGVGWFPLEYDLEGYGNWIPLRPTAPPRHQTESGSGRPALLDKLSSTPQLGPRRARRERSGLSAARKDARGRAGNRRSYNRLPSRRQRLMELAILGFIVAVVIAASAVWFLV